MAGTQARNLESVTEGKTMEEQCLLACSARLAQHALLYTPGPLPRGGAACSELDSTPSITNEENAPQIVSRPI